MNLGFEVEAAKPKRQGQDEDAPTNVPMRAGLNDARRRKPMTDDKKVRHQMARQQRRTATLEAMAAAFARRIEAGDRLLMNQQYEMTQNIYQLGYTDALDGKPANPEGVVGLGVSNTYGHPQEDEREWYIRGYTDGMADRGTAPHPLEDRAPELALAASYTNEHEGALMDTSIQREADLLEAMAHATLDEQRRLAADLDALRANRRIAFEDDRDTEFADEIVADHLTPVVTHALNTTATDWLGEFEDDLPDQDQVQQLAATEASLWWGRAHEAVRADRTEVNVQARGYASRWASQYGLHAEAAAHAFLFHVAHLARYVVAEGGEKCAVCGASIERDPPNEDPQTWHHADGEKHDHEAKPAGDGDKKESAKTALRTVADVADLAAFEVEAATDDEFAFEGAVTAADSPGEVDPEQSGEAESSLPYDRTVADETTPWLAEDWPGGDQPVIDPPMTGAGEGTTSSRHTATDGARSHCRICGHELEQHDNTWYALSKGSPKRETPKHYHIPARGPSAHAPGEYDHEGNLTPGEPEGGIIHDNGANPIRIEKRHEGSVTAADADKPHAYESGDPIGGGWGSGPKCKVCGKEPNAEVHMLYHRGQREAADDGSIFCKRCGGQGMVRAGGVVRNCTSCKGTGLRPAPRRTMQDAVGKDYQASRQVLGEAPWNAGYDDAQAGRPARVASRDVGSDPWYYTEGYLAGMDGRQAAVGDPDEAGAARGVPEEIKKLDDPENRPMWPWDLEDPGNGAADVANAKNPNDHTSSQRTAVETPQPDGRGRHRFSDGGYGCPHGCPVALTDAAEYDYHMDWHKQEDERDRQRRGSVRTAVPEATSKLAAFRATIAANLKKSAA